MRWFVKRYYTNDTTDGNHSNVSVLQLTLECMLSIRVDSFSTVFSICVFNMILMLLFIIVLHDGQCQVEEPKERRLEVFGLRKKVQYIEKFWPPRSIGSPI